MGLAKNILLNQAGNAITIATGFVFQLIILRYFGIEEAAAYFLSLSISYFSLLPSNFLLNVMIRYIPFYAGKKEWMKVKSTLFISILYILTITMLLGVIMSLFSNTIENYIDGLGGKISYVVALMVLLNIYNLVRTIHTSFEKFREVSLMNSILAILKLIFLIVLTFYGMKNYEGIMTSFYIALIISTIYGLVKSNYFVEIIKRVKGVLVDKQEILNMIKYSISTFIDNTRVSVLSWIDIMFLGHFSTPFNVSGYGGTASMARTISNFVVGPFFHPLLVRMSEEEGKKIDSLSLFKKSTKYLTLFSAIIGGILFVSSKELLELLIPKYVSFYYIVQIFSFVLFFFSISSSCKIALMSKRWLKPLLYSSILIIIIDIVLNFFMIKLYHSLGAAISTLIAFIAEFTFFLLFFKKEFSVNLERIVGKHFILLLVMLIPYWLEVENTIISLFTKTGLSLIIAALFIYLFEKPMIKESIDIIKRLVKK